MTPSTKIIFLKNSDQATSIKTKVDKQLTSRSSTLWTKTPTQKYKFHKHFKSHHDAIYVVDAEGAHKKNLKFYQTLQTALFLSTRSPKGLHQEGLPHQGQSRYWSQDSRL